MKTHPTFTPDHMAFSSRTTAADTPATWWDGPLPFILLASAVLAAYANVFHNAFLHDDTELITGNAFLRSWHFIPTLFRTHIGAGAGIQDYYYRPFQILLYLITFQLFGLSLPAFHALNVALHGANACLVLALGKRLGFPPAPVFVASLLWALHPLHTEIIAYVSGTADPLFVCFCLSALVILLPRVTVTRVMWVTPLFIAALLTKEEAVMFPGLVACCIFLKEDDRLSLRPYLKLWPLAVAAGVYILLRLTLLTIGNAKVLGHGAPRGLAVDPSPPLLTFFATLPVYLRLLVWPTHLHLERSFPAFPSLWNAQVLAGLALTVLAAYQVVWRQRRDQLPLSFGILWFVTAYFLHTGLPFVLKTPLMEHWMYLPTVGLALGLAEQAHLALAAPRVAALRRGWAAIALLASGALAILTWNQNLTWRTAETFYTSILDNGENSARIHNNFGNALLANDDYEAAERQYRLAIEASNDTDPYAHLNLALALARQEGDETRNDAEIAAHLKRSLELDPDFYPANKALADLYTSRNRLSDAAPYAAQAERLKDKLSGHAP